MVSECQVADHKIDNRHKLIIAVFAVIMAVGWTAYSYYLPYQMGHDQICLGTMIAKDLDPQLYPRDYAFRDNSLYRNYIPFFRQLIRGLMRLTGSFENALLALVPLVVLTYALGLALLLMKISGSLWAALLLTFLSMPYRPAPGGEIWGVGGMEYILARTLATALVPYLFILFFSLLKRPNLGKGVALGGLTGLLAFLHPPTALFTGEIFVLLLVWAGFQNPRQWLILGALMLFYGLAAFYPLTVMEQSGAGVGPPVNFREFSQVVSTILKVPTDWGGFLWGIPARRVWLLLGATLILGLNYLLRPASQRPRALLTVWLWGGLVVLYLGWRIAGKGAGLSWFYFLAALYLLLRYRRQDPQPLDWWLLGMGFVVLVISLFPSYVFTLLWLRLEFLPLTTLVVEHYRAVRLLHLFIFLLSARVAVYLVGEISEYLKTSKTAVMAEYTLVGLSTLNKGLFWIVLGGVILYEALRQVCRSRRLALAGALTVGVVGLGGLMLTQPSLKGFWPGLRQPGPALRLPGDLNVDAALYAWARSHTPKDALFFTNSAAFRYQAQRSITHSQADLINYRDRRFVDFFHHYQNLEEVYGSPQALARLASGVDFIVVEKTRRVRLRFPVVFENHKYLVYQTGPKRPGLKDQKDD